MDVEMGVRELRRDLASTLRRAGAGQHIVVRVADRPIARIGPIASPSGEVTLAGLAARGLVVPARRPDRPLPDVVVPLRVGTRLDRLVAEIRS